MFNRIIPLILLGCCAHLSAQDWNQDYTVASNTPGDKFASSICAIGDVNGDQVDDFVTGTPQESSAHFNSGSISIYSGADGSLLATRSGEEHGEQAGSRFAYLGLYSNTDVALFACSSPFFASSNGMFSGIVRIYSFDKSTQTLDLFHTIDGPIAGTMFGMSLDSYQFDLIPDSRLELAVGAIGHNSLSGAVFVYQISDDLTSVSLINTIEGAAGSREMLGFSVASAQLNGQGTLIMGAPFASDGAPASGAVPVLLNSGAILNLNNPFSNVAGAHLGYTVAGGTDVSGDGVPDFVSGTPDVGNGHIVTWNHGQSSGLTLQGPNADEGFGSSVAMIDDYNFDGVAELLVGAPNSMSNRGRAAIHAVNTPSQNEIRSFSGSNVGDHLGSDLALLNDGNSEKLLISGKGSNSITGKIESYSMSVGDISLASNGTYDVLTDVNLQASGLFANSVVYFYVGDSNSPSTVGNHQLDISGNVQLFSSFTTSGGTAAETYLIDEHHSDDSNLFFQVVEEYGNLTRYTDITGGTVQFDDITTGTNGNFEWNTDVSVRAYNLLSPSTVYFYVGESDVASTVGSHDLNISGNVQLLATIANSNDIADHTFSVPDTYPDGTTLYFQVVEEFNSITRYSSLSSGTVAEPTLFELQNQGNTAGSQMMLQATGATVGATVNFYGTPNPSLDPIFGTLIDSATANNNGNALVTVMVPAGFSGVTGYLRAQDQSNGNKTQILTISFI